MQSKSFTAARWDLIYMVPLLQYSHSSNCTSGVFYEICGIQNEQVWEIQLFCLTSVDQFVFTRYLRYIRDLKLFNKVVNGMVDYLPLLHQINLHVPDHSTVYRQNDYITRCVKLACEHSNLDFCGTINLFKTLGECIEWIYWTISKLYYFYPLFFNIIVV